MGKLKAKSINVKKEISLHGQFGEFNLINKKNKVKYFSTFASTTNSSHDSLELLKELKPMRERVKARDISNLNSLLQRDLNDFRVANDLIPYLININPPVAFFPAVLAVLIPKGFIAQNEETEYPTKANISEDDDLKVEGYGEFWRASIFKLEKKLSTLGMLSIDLANVDIIVLDGQHRANAFRVVTGTFSDDNSIYSSFYKDIDLQADFNADLPVTIVWFDNDTPKFDPKVISRRLFVDVNNSAKKVSQSRTILLDEYEIPSLLTRFFYSSLADEKQFQTGEFSLFHSDFDLDSDINQSANNNFAITSPQIIYDVMSWLTLGKIDRYYESSSYNVAREMFRSSLPRFGNIFNGTAFNEQDILVDEDNNNRRVIIRDFDKIDCLEQEYKKKLATALISIFRNFILYRKHFEACTNIEKEYNDSTMDHTEMAVWEDVFKGGEGLYYTFKDRNLRSGGKKSHFIKYVKAIDELEKRLKINRSKLFVGSDLSKVNQAFESANTKAFQVGLFMALDFYAKNYNLSLNDASEDFLELLNRKNENDWIVILTEIKPKVFKETDPKKWPSYHKIILRTVQDASFTIYDAENYMISPDGVIFEKLLITALNSWIGSQEDVDYVELTAEVITLPIINKWIDNAQFEIEKLFNSAHISLIENVDYRKIGKELIDNQLSNIRE